MKTKEDLEKDVQGVIKLDSLLNATDAGATTKFGKHLKKFVYVISLVGIGLSFNACIPGYIETEPTYMESSRPPQPSSVHIWIDGDWVWSRQTHAYVRNNGYWAKPNQGRTFVPGRWQSTPRGKYWVKGQWQRQGR